MSSTHTSSSPTGTSTTARAFGDAVADVLASVGGNARTVEELDTVVDQRSASAVLTQQRARLVETGLPGLLVPEASGGSGVLEEGEAFAALVAVARAAGAVPGPDIAGPWAVAPTVLRLAGAHEALLERAASGEERFAVVDLGGGPTDTPAARNASEARVSGTAVPDTVRLVDADDADGVLVLAPGRITLVRDLPLVPAPSFDPTRPVSTVRGEVLSGGKESGEVQSRDQLSDERPSVEVLAKGPDADQISALARALGRVVLAAELHGTGQELLRLAVEHLQTRMAFGRPLGSFQALKHRAADIWSELSLVGSLVDEAANQLEALLAGDAAGDSAGNSTTASAAGSGEATASSRIAASASTTASAEASAYAAAALSLAADTVVHAGEEVLQLHGGIGYTWESPVHILLKRAIATRGRWGSPHELRRLVAAQFDL